MRPELFRIADIVAPSYFILLLSGFIFATTMGVLWARRTGEDPWATTPDKTRPRRITDDLAWLRQAFEDPPSHGLRPIPPRNARGKVRSCHRPGRKALRRHRSSICAPRTSPPTPASTG